MPVDVAEVARVCREKGSDFLRIHYFPAISSTQDEAKKLGQSGAPEGTLVIAGMQTQGRGRAGRRWFSPKGAGVYVSMVLRPNQPKDKWQSISVIAGVSLVEALIALGIKDARLKWPNDALIKGKKIAGLLLEAEPLHGFVVLGLGLNADFSAVTLPEDIKETATDLKSHLPEGQSLVEACATCVCSVFNGYRRSLPDLEVDSGRADMLLWTSGEVQVLGQKGKVLGLGPRGELRLLDESQREFWVTCGEVQDALVH